MEVYTPQRVAQMNADMRAWNASHIQQSDASKEQKEANLRALYPSTRRFQPQGPKHSSFDYFEYMEGVR